MTYSGYNASEPHLPTMTEKYKQTMNAAYNKYPALVNMDLKTGYEMANNKFLRNIIFYRDPKAKLFQHTNLPFDKTQSDYNLIHHFGLPLITDVTNVRNASTRNLAPNAGLENGAAGQMPTNWSWHIRPNDSATATISDREAHSGKQSLRLGGASATDAQGRTQWTAVMSDDIPIKAGQPYQLTVWMKADKDGTQAQLLVQSYKANVHYWGKATSVTLSTQWKQYKLTFTTPAAGSPDFIPTMKSLYVRFDLQQAEGALWLDDVSLNEAQAMTEWQSWQALGLDTHSIVADPMFVNAARDDYRLKPSSPAWKLGFKPIPVEKIGPYKSALRASWPIKEAEGAREKPLTNH
jgi:hypothetical protein